MRLNEARIGYGGYSRDLAAPGDRRRFSAYAAQKGLRYERAELGRPYDLVLITHNSDLPGWTARKRREGGRLKLVFELVDSYFVETRPMRRLLKGSTRRLLGTDSRLSPDFLRTLERACEVADAVICSTAEQRQRISSYNDNVHLSFDYFGDELGRPKRSYERGEKLKLVWEGQPVTIRNLQAIREPLNDLREDVELNVVTDPMVRTYIYSNRWRPTLGELEGIECEKRLHPWEKASFSDRITECDLALIPIDTSDAMMRGKPENKLVLLWQLGMPVLTSRTAAYERAMAGAGLDMTCRSTTEWGERLEEMVRAGPQRLEPLALEGRRYAETAYSPERFRALFDAVFASIGLA